MPLATFHNYPATSGTNIIYRTNPASALDIFAAAGQYNRRQRRFRRNKFGVDQAMANLVFYSPMMKADTVIEGDADRWHHEMAEEISKKELSDSERRVILANSTIGMLAAPAAMYGALKAAKDREGGMPRTVIRGAANLKPVRGSKSAKRANRIITALERPKTRKALVASGLAGAAGVGLQAAAIAGDAVANRATRGKE
jgi:hypothetical protein